MDLIIDDTPEAVIISCFNPLRRETARQTLERLIADGRIHPARIEETARRVEAEMATTMQESGEQAAFDLGITDLNTELIILLGRLKFRSVATQSMLQHAVETAQICGMLAQELESIRGAVVRALPGVILALDQIPMAYRVGAFCKKYGERLIAGGCPLHHTEDRLENSVLAIVVGAASNLSASRPNARKEQLGKHIKRLQDLETLASSFPAVESAQVFQAGREVRVLLYPDSTTDQDARDLSDDIAVSMRDELTFPGQVRISVIRESRVVKFAT